MLHAAGSFSKTTTRTDMNPKKYWVYIVGSLTGTLYIGMTNNIDRRIGEHKSREFEGFALKYHRDRLVYYESFDDVRKAIDREKQLKGWIRAKKVALITSINPKWQDLAENGERRWRLRVSARRADERMPRSVLS